MRWPVKHRRLWRRRFAWWPVRVSVGGTQQWVWLEAFYEAEGYMPGDGCVAVARKAPGELTAQDLLDCDALCRATHPPTTPPSLWQREGE